ncbi:MAG: hypothetical protein AAFX52_06545 [Pseudomonadota bacterium]
MKNATSKNLQKLVLLFHPRSGSSWLRSMLDENDYVWMVHEILARVGSPGQQHAKIDDVYNQGRPKRITVVGSKVAPYQIIDKIGFVQQVRDLGIKPIVIQRRSLVRTVISQIRRRELSDRELEAGRQAAQNLRVDMEPLGPSTINSEEFTRFLLSDYKERSNLMLLASAFDQRLELVYEDLLEDPAHCLAQVSDFIGTEIDYLGDGVIARNTGDDLSAVVTNLAELRAVTERLGFAFDA